MNRTLEHANLWAQYLAQVTNIAEWESEPVMVSVDCLWVKDRTCDSTAGVQIQNSIMKASCSVMNFRWVSHHTQMLEKEASGRPYRWTLTSNTYSIRSKPSHDSKWYENDVSCQTLDAAFLSPRKTSNKWPKSTHRSASKTCLVSEFSKRYKQ